MAAPKVDKVEPPNWRTPYSLNPVQLLLSGSDLGGAVVTTASKGFKIEVRKISENGHYLFVYLDIAKDVRPVGRSLSSSLAKFRFTWRSTHSSPCGRASTQRTGIARRPLV